MQVEAAPERHRFHASAGRCRSDGQREACHRTRRSRTRHSPGGLRAHNRPLPRPGAGDHEPRSFSPSCAFSVRLPSCACPPPSPARRACASTRALAATLDEERCTLERFYVRRVTRTTRSAGWRTTLVRPHRPRQRRGDRPLRPRRLRWRALPELERAAHDGHRRREEVLGAGVKVGLARRTAPPTTTSRIYPSSRRAGMLLARLELGLR